VLLKSNKQKVQKYPEIVLDTFVCTMMVKTAFPGCVIIRTTGGSRTGVQMVTGSGFTN